MSNITLPDEIRSEFTINRDGSVTATRRATARLAGVDPTQLYHASRDTGLLKNLADGKSPSKILEPFVGKEFRGDGKSLPDLLVAAIIQYYAFKGNDTAQATACAFSAIGIRSWLRYQLNYQPPEPEPSPKTPTIPIQATLDDINAIFAGIYELPIERKLIESAKLTAIAKTFPHLSNAAEVGKQMLSSNMIVEECPLSPTKLGKIIAQQLDLDKPISARRINETLVKASLQVAERVTNSKGKTKIQYQLTERGEHHGRMQMDTTQRVNKTVYVVRWFESVIPLIIDEFKR